MSGILPGRWKVGLADGDICILSSDAIFRSLIPFGFVFKYPHIWFLELKTPRSIVEW